MTMTEKLVWYYNIFILSYILCFINSFEYAIPLVLIHIVFMLFWPGLALFRQKLKRKYIQYLFFIIPIVLLSIFHYETGLINTLLFPNYFDYIIKHLDSFIFGIHFNQILSQFYNYFLIDQFFHFVYFLYYIVLLLPVSILYFSRNHQKNYHEKMLFSIMMSAFMYFVIFFIFPVIGPIQDRAVLHLFNDAGGFVAVMDYLFKVGDLDGGAMPSSHVGLSVIVYLNTRKYLPAISMYVLVVMLLISIATIYCSYHYTVDVIVGYLTAYIFWIISNRVYNRLIKQSL
jgi:membrane-associated phospholipid phosphatase